jgi:hypothetical protein
MSSPQNSASPQCDDVRQQFALLLYGELSFEEEEQIQGHLSLCDACRDAFVSEQAIHEILDRNAQTAEPSPDLLAANRNQLRAVLANEPVPGGSFWMRLRAAFNLVAPRQLWRPVAAMALVVIGFLGGQWYSERGHVTAARIAGEPVSARVRQVDSSGDGMLQLVVDETRQRVIRGSVNDMEVRQLLLAATMDPNDAGLRGETVEILVTTSPTDETRAALIRALLQDQSDGVRLRAFEGLKPYAGLPEVRRAMAQALLRDSNAGLRTQAIDVLTQSRSDLSTEMGIVSIFQELLQTESNGYIRSQCQRKLREMKASEEVY